MPEQPKQDSFKHIIRVASVDLPGEKQIRWALTKIKGVGINFADAICAAAQVRKQEQAGTLGEQQIAALNELLANPLQRGIPSWLFNRKKDYETGEHIHLLGGTLAFTRENDIKRLRKIKVYRGVRHSKGLPVRGQRTRSNFRKSKGKVVGVAKKKLSAQAKAEGKEGKKEAKR